MEAPRTPPHADSAGAARAATGPRLATEPANLGLLTDLYQLTMVQACLDEGLRDVAVFSLVAGVLLLTEATLNEVPPAREAPAPAA
jgi:hypothetical protein